jgi:transposase
LPDGEENTALIDDLDRQIAQLTRELKHRGADHRYVPLLMTAPAIGPVTAFTIASEIGDITRFASPSKLVEHRARRPHLTNSSLS